MELKTIDYETAKLAKEVGICIGTMTYYFNDEQLWDETSLSKTIKTPCYNQLDDCLEAPTQELLRQFLRTEHNIHIQMGLQDRMNPQMNNGFEFQGYCPILIIFYESGSLQQYSELPIKPNSSYEEALEAGLKKALNYLLNQKE